MNNYIDLVLDEQLYKDGIVRYIRWNYTKYPHILICGSTGTGKSYLLKILLGRIGRHVPDSEIIICDYKGDSDFDFCSKSSNNLYRFTSCSDGLNKAVKYLTDRQSRITDDKHFVAFVFDEWASYLNSMPKKERDAAIQDLSILLMLARSFNIHVIVSQQRMDSVYFANARDNFSCVIGMGSLSKEFVQMAFSEYKDIIDPNKTQGHGSMILGNEFKNILVPKVSNFDVLHQSILDAVNRY